MYRQQQVLAWPLTLGMAQERIPSDVMWSCRFLIRVQGLTDKAKKSHDDEGQRHAGRG
jgi:hypothetical protein